MKFPNLGSIGKNLNLLIMLAVLPALLIILHSGFDQRNHAIEAARFEVLFLANTMAEVQHGIARSTRQLLSVLTHLPEIKSRKGQGGSEILRALIAQNPDFINITATDITGEVVASGLPSAKANLADRKHVREALATKDFAAGEYVVTRVGIEAPSFTFAFPELDGKGQPTGVLAGALSLERFARIFDVATLPEDSFLAVTDHRGIKLFRYPATENTNPIGEAIAAKAWEAAGKTQKAGIILFRGNDGVRRIVAFRPVHLGPANSPYMYMWAGVSEDRVLKHANTVLARNLLLMLLATILALVISWLIGRNTLISPVGNWWP